MSEQSYSPSAGSDAVSTYFNQPTSRGSTGLRSNTPHPLSNPYSPDTSQVLSRIVGSSEYAISSRPGTSLSRMSGRSTRPSTAGGRKSRATTASTLGASESQSIICAICEARGVSPSVGLAFINVFHGECTLSQLCDNRSYVKTTHKLHVMNPSRILFNSSTLQTNSQNTLLSIIKDVLPQVRVDECDRSAWSECSGVNYIESFAFESDVPSMKVALQGKHYAICSFAAAMEFVEQNLDISFAPHSLRVKYQPPDDTMMIDISAIRALEIMQNSLSSKSKDSLLALLDQTVTPMGSRMLRNNILQPPTLYDSFIAPRFAALDELGSNEEMFRDIRIALKPFHDVERVLTKFITIATITGLSQIEERLSQILMIKSFLEATTELYKALAPSKTDLMVKIRNLCRQEIVTPILRQIREVIEADVTYMKSALDLRNQRTFAVKAGISGMLDVSRQTYKELTEDVHQHVEELNQTHSLSATLRYDNRRKYWLRIKMFDCDSTARPDVLINVVQKRDYIECQTLELVKLNIRLSEVSIDIAIRSDSVVESLVCRLRLEVPHLFRICEAVGLVDMITSFAQLASTRDYVRPEITSVLALKAARHPLLDKTLDEKYIPNDYYATEHHSFHVVTGSNMSGKSTYLRAVTLLQIMAQIGSFVPAEYASFPIVHNIFARISTDDNIEASLSTFSLEMREMAFILRNIDQNSLVIIDELGRGTSNTEGLAIAMAISEALIDSKALVWFATHFTDLARAFSEVPGVLTLQLQSQCTTSSSGAPLYTMMYKAAPGIVDDSEHYGIHLARAIGFPPTLTARAEEVANNLQRTREANRVSSAAHKAAKKRQLVLELYDSLRLAKECGVNEALPAYLKRLQAEFILRMEEVEGEGSSDETT